MAVVQVFTSSPVAPLYITNTWKLKSKINNLYTETCQTWLFNVFNNLCGAREQIKHLIQPNHLLLKLRDQKLL